MEQYQIEQMNMIKIGRLIQREWPDDEFADLEEIRMFVNYDLLTEIRVGMALTEVLQILETAIQKRNYEWSMKVV